MTVQIPTLLLFIVICVRLTDVEPVLLIKDGGPNLDQLAGVIYGPNCRDNMRG